MFLAIDIGNTQTVMGLFDGDELVAGASDSCYVYDIYIYRERERCTQGTYNMYMYI